MNLSTIPSIKNSRSVIIAFSVVVLLVIVVIAYLLVTRFNVPVPFVSNIVKDSLDKTEIAEVVPLYDEKTKKPNAKFFELAMQKDFEEVKAQTDGQITSPNLYQQDLREELDKKLNRQIQNFSVTYTDSGFGPGSITITQGDLVTFENTSSGNLKIIGEGWGSGLELDNKEINRFSQQFDLLGTYKYSSETNPEHKGEVIVVKPE